MNQKSPFKWRHYLPEIILLCVRWYLRYPLSYRGLAEMMAERRKHLRTTNDSWKVDETYIKMKGKWKYLYRAIDKEGKTIDFLLSAKRDANVATRFLQKALRSSHSVNPRVINTDKAKAYPKALKKLNESGLLSDSNEHRAVKYLNNLIEQDHRYTKRKVSPVNISVNFGVLIELFLAMNR